MKELPLVSVIVTTFNRADTITRALDSIKSQTYTNLDIIVVDDGSTDQTLKNVEQISDERIRVYKHEHNKGVCAAKNTGLNNIRGEWFFIVDSDDEIEPTTIEELIRIPLEHDKDVNHVICNVVDYPTKKWHGRGFVEDQPWTIESTSGQIQGAFKGMIKTELLRSDRLNENVTGFEDVLWTKIRARSKGFYIHRGLYIWHTEGDDRVIKKKAEFNIQEEATQYRELSYENEYWEIVSKYAENTFIKRNFAGLVYLLAHKDKKVALVYYRRIIKSNLTWYYKVLARIIIIAGPKFSLGIIRLRKTSIRKK